MTVAEELTPEEEVDAIHGFVRHLKHEWEGPQSWVAQALCRGQAGRTDRVFFPERGGSVKEAKVQCGQCPVQPQCLEYALKTKQEHGVWGGTTERERKRMLRESRTQQELQQTIRTVNNIKEQQRANQRVRRGNDTGDQSGTQGRASRRRTA